MSETTEVSTQHAICHYCGICCGVTVEIETQTENIKLDSIDASKKQNRKLLSLIGNKDNAVYHGYSCTKGRELPNHLFHPDRLLRPLKRNKNGEFSTIESSEAISEIAERIKNIVDQHGPNAVALYNGTYGLQPPYAMTSAAFMKSLRSKMTFATATIDQPGKVIALALHGHWRGGCHAFSNAEAWLLLGTNPEVSKLGGIPSANPAYYLHRAQKNGLQLIVIDPRVTEAAKKAEIHLQPKPGHDAAILAAMLNIILSEGLHDENFVAENTQDLANLREAVTRFTPETVAQQADINANELIRAARLFAKAKTAGANAGTGVNMGAHGTLTEYLLLCLNTVCGHVLGAGDPVPNPGVLTARAPAIAQAHPGMPAAWGFPPFLKATGLSNTMSGLPTAALADEILHDGESKIRALICVGGNPMMAWPDQIKTKQAMEELDLLVVMDPKLTETAKFADYVLAPKLSMETPICTLENEALQHAYPSWGYPAPYAQYAPTLVDPPSDSDLLEDWQFMYQLAQQLQLELTVSSGIFPRPYDPAPIKVALDMTTPPSTDDLLDIATRGSRISLDEVKQYPEGHVFEAPDITVLEKESGCKDTLALANEFMMEQLQNCDLPALEDDNNFAFRLISRRMPNFLNSQGRDLEKLTWKYRYNPAFMNPTDMRAHGLKTGDTISIASRRTSILGIVEAEDGVRSGVISMAHSFGKAPNDGEKEDAQDGSHTGRLSSNDLDFAEAFTGLPRMSAIPVNITQAGLFNARTDGPQCRS